MSYIALFSSSSLLPQHPSRSKAARSRSGWPDCAIVEAFSCIFFGHALEERCATDVTPLYRTSDRFFVLPQE
jgi:hypothetical protein